MLFVRDLVIFRMYASEGSADIFSSLSCQGWLECARILLALFYGLELYTYMSEARVR